MCGFTTSFPYESGHRSHWGVSKSRVIVLSVVRQGLSKAETARRFGVTWRWVHEPVHRYETGGLDAGTAFETPALEPARVVALRQGPTAAGWDAGRPASNDARLEREGTAPPAISTIRILLEAQLIGPEPKKRPRSAMIRLPSN